MVENIKRGKTGVAAAGCTAQLTPELGETTWKMFSQYAFKILEILHGKFLQCPVRTSKNRKEARKNIMGTPPIDNAATANVNTFVLVSVQYMAIYSAR